MKSVNDDMVLQDNEMAFAQGQLYDDSCVIIEQSQTSAYRSVNEILVKRNWLLGMRIQQEILKEERAEYDERVVVNLAKS